MQIALGHYTKPEGRIITQCLDSISDDDLANLVLNKGRLPVHCQIVCICFSVLHAYTLLIYSRGSLMEFDFTTLPAADRYRLLTNFVVPRPIALVTTRAEEGHDNAAPMSFFNVFAQEPPLLILGLQARAGGAEKDTTAHIRRTGEFVVNMVDMAIAEQMIVCGVNLARDVDELKLAGLTAVPSLQVGVSRIAESPCSMECRVERIIDYPNRAIVIGEVVQMHVRSDCLDPAGRYVDPEKYRTLARLHGDTYIVADRQFELVKPKILSEAENKFLKTLSNY